MPRDASIVVPWVLDVSRVFAGPGETLTRDGSRSPSQLDGHAECSSMECTVVLARSCACLVVCVSQPDHVILSRLVGTVNRQTVGLYPGKGEFLLLQSPVVSRRSSFSTWATRSAQRAPIAPDAASHARRGCPQQIHRISVHLAVDQVACCGVCRAAGPHHQ